MKKIFHDLPEALENNYNLPLRCSFRPEYSKPLLPDINSNSDISSNDQLKKDANEGLINKFKEKFEDENFKITHQGRGTLYMSNTGPNTNGS